MKGNTCELYYIPTPSSTSRTSSCLLFAHNVYVEFVWSLNCLFATPSPKMLEFGKTNPISEYLS